MSIIKPEGLMKYIVFASIALIIISALTLLSNFQGSNIKIQIGDTYIDANVADDKEERSKGLSGVKELADGKGLLFIFDKPGNWGIWMKDMLINIDVIWLDESKKIVHIEKDLSPSTYPKVFEPKTATKYVIEVPSGFINRHNISVGTLVSFNSWLPI